LKAKVKEGSKSVSKSEIGKIQVVLDGDITRASQVSFSVSGTFKTSSLHTESEAWLESDKELRLKAKKGKALEDYDKFFRNRFK